MMALCSLSNIQILEVSVRDKDKIDAKLAQVFCYQFRKAFLS